MNWNLLALGKGSEEKKNWRDVAVPESVQSCFELPIRFPEFFPSNYFLIAVHGWFPGNWIYRQMFGNVKTELEGKGLFFFCLLHLRIVKFFNR